MAGKNGPLPKIPRQMPVRYHEDFASVMDGRSRLARAVRDRLEALISDLGGEDALSHAQISLCRRAVWIELMVEHEESRIAEGSGVDVQPHVALVSSLVSIYRVLGVKRQARQARLSEYLQRSKSTLLEGSP
jgi:hypothetical protein